MTTKSEKGPETEKVAEKAEKRNVLLGTISYTDEKDYEEFLNKIDVNQAVFILIAGVNSAQAKGAYNLEESELIAKAIKAIKSTSVKKEEVKPESE